ncbi:SUMO-conjugating enzyme ubc9 [Favolaschia claudopus]|uniref:SUMO-conjugating enzyme ubc9 n=1 Tax=Favolaschia claudopus TaxID=2862362 RepID=A0AAW0CZN7_9AGAR
MASDPFLAASNKRKRLDAEDDAERERTSSLIRRAIALVAANPEIPATSLQPVLGILAEAHGSALFDEASNLRSADQAEEWNWELSKEQISRLSEEELTIWKDVLPCRVALAHTGIKIHPVNWKMPVLDLRQWQVHIPGRQGTSWEGGVYSLDVIFPPGLSEDLPRCRFLAPLLHPNTYPSGTWGYLPFPEISTSDSPRTSGAWAKSRPEDPARFAKLLCSIKNLLHEPVLDKPSQSDAYTLLKNDPKRYEEKVKEQAIAWTPCPRTGLAGRPILQTLKP